MPYFKALYENSPVAIVTLDSEHKVVTANPAFERLFGFTEAELQGQPIDGFIAGPQQQDEARANTNRVQQGETIATKGVRRRKDGRLIDVEIRGVPVIVDGQQRGVLGMYMDITDRVKKEKLLQESEAKFKSLFEYSPVPLWELDLSQVRAFLSELPDQELSALEQQLDQDPDMIASIIDRVEVKHTNEAVKHLVHMDEGELLGTQLRHFFTERSLLDFGALIKNVWAGGTRHLIETVIPTADGDLRKISLFASIPPSAEKSWSTVYISMIDITERKTLERELLESVHKMEILARTDQLTGILNRRAIMEKGREELSRSRREGNGLGICLIDIDNLKDINDRFGHLAGDSALRLVAKTIRQLCRDYDQVGRWGGDEFLMFVPNVPRSALREIAERIRFQIDVADLVSADGDAIAVQVCIGIAHSGDMQAVDNELEHLISMADNGLYVAKGQGRNRVGEVQDN